MEAMDETTVGASAVWDPTGLVDVVLVVSVTSIVRTTGFVSS